MKTSRCRKHGVYTEAEAYVSKNEKYKNGIMLRCKKCIHEGKVFSFKKNSYNHCAIHGELNKENAYYYIEHGRERFRCKECKKEHRAKQYADNREQAIKDAGIWKKNNRGRINLQTAIDKKENPEKYKKWRLDYYERNKKEINTRVICRSHGVDVDSYEDMFKKQNSVCAICGEEEKRLFKGKVMRLCLDHDHITGKIRALLCHDCNTGLGKFRDNPDLLTEAAIYLSEHREKDIP